jgi:hypothetical protein
MPKLLCPCGFVHDLSPIPDDGWQTIRDKEMESYMERSRIYADGFRAAPGTPEREASFCAFHNGPLVGLLYECPKCGRVMWRKTHVGDFQVYAPESTPT